MSVEHRLETSSAEHELRSLVYHGFAFPHLSAAYRLGLFAFLRSNPGATQSEIAVALDLQERPVRVLLLGCTTFGLTAKTGDGYHNTALTELISTNEDQMPAAFIPFMQHMTYLPVGWLYESLRSNTNIGMQRELLDGSSATTLYERLAEDPTLESAFHTMMSAFSTVVLNDLKTALDFSAYTHVLDVGGGTGTNAISFALQWPHLHVTVLDLPTVAAAATARIAEAGVADRVQAIGFDIAQDEFPTGFDCVVFAHFLEIWSPERIRGLFAKASRAVGDEGDIVVVAAAQHDDETGPEHAAWMSTYVQAVASPEGAIYTPREFEEWITEAGFTPTGRQYPGDFDVVICGSKRSGTP